MSKVQLNHVFTRRLCLFLWLSIWFASAASGQTEVVADSVRASSQVSTIRFFYPPGVSEFLLDYRDNASAFSLMDTFINTMQKHPAEEINRIVISGSSSIEGRYAMNEALARDRAKKFYLHLCTLYPSLRYVPHDLTWVAEDWNTLSDFVRKSDISEREEVLKIVRHVRAYEDRERLIRRLNRGRPYVTIKRSILPLLRRVDVDFNSDSIESIHTLVLATERFNPSEVVLLERTIREGSQFLFDDAPTNESYRFALKTNMLQWAGILPDFKHTSPVANVALEYFFADRWSVELGAAGSYWYYNHKQNFQGISGYSLELRRSHPLIDRYDRFPEQLDLFLGLYGRIGDYDIRKEQETINHTGEYWDTGLSAGLYLRLFGGWGLELGARAGYLHTNATRYAIDGQNNWFGNKQPYSKMRMTGLNVNLVYRFK